MVNRLIGYLGTSVNILHCSHTRSVPAIRLQQLAQYFAPWPCSCTTHTLQATSAQSSHVHASPEFCPCRVPAMPCTPAGHDDKRGSDHGQETVSCRPLGTTIRVWLPCTTAFISQTANFLPGPYPFPFSPSTMSSAGPHTMLVALESGFAVSSSVVGQNHVWMQLFMCFAMSLLHDKSFVPCTITIVIAAVIDTGSVLAMQQSDSPEELRGHRKWCPQR